MRASLILGAGFGLIAACACSAGGSGNLTGTGGGHGGSGNNGQGGIDLGLGGNGGPLQLCTANCTDFPKDPIFDQGAPTNAPQLFGDPANFSTPGPCVVEPTLGDQNQPGALYPYNWLRPRFRWTAGAGETLFEVRLAAKSQTNNLVAYTTASQWAIPKPIWDAVRNDSVDEPITVTIRGVNSGAPGKPTGSQGTITIAPVAAEGTMVYWATNSSQVSPTASKLVGFAVGDEGVIDALTVTQVGSNWNGVIGQDGAVLRGYWSDSGQAQQTNHGVAIGTVECIGCHSSTPDGDAVGFTDGWPWDDVLSSVKEHEAGIVPSYVSPGAKFLLGQPWLGTMTFSKAHWASGNRLAITSYMTRNTSSGGGGFWNGKGAMCPLNPSKDAYNPYLIQPEPKETLAWFDLETPWTPPAWAPNTGYDQTKIDALNAAVSGAVGKGFGFINLQGEAQNAVNPVWSHDGTKIVYTSATYTQDGHPGGGQSWQSTNNVDIKVVDFNNKAGGAVTPVPGASDPGTAEFYPSLSPDDKYVAFNRSANTGPIYYRPDGEIWVTPLDGSQPPLRLAANSPPQCTAQPSPGVINSWAKWAPAVGTGKNGKSYYFLIFSSARAYQGQFNIPPATDTCVANLAPDRRSSQLYITAVVRDADGKLTSYGSIYLWNQDPTWSNLTPAWDVFQIPPVPPPK